MLAIALVCIASVVLSLGAARVILVPVDWMIRRGFNTWLTSAVAMSLIITWMAFVLIVVVSL